MCHSPGAVGIPMNSYLHKNAEMLANKHDMQHIFQIKTYTQQLFSNKILKMVVSCGFLT